jgi:hypothetical protein
MAKLHAGSRWPVIIKPDDTCTLTIVQYHCASVANAIPLVVVVVVVVVVAITTHTEQANDSRAKIDIQHLVVGADLELYIGELQRDTRQLHRIVDSDVLCSSASHSLVERASLDILSHTLELFLLEDACESVHCQVAEYQNQSKECIVLCCLGRPDFLHH